MNAAITVLCGIAILIGLVGIVVPLLPGLLLELAAVLAWAVFVDGGVARWVTLGASAVLAGAGMVVKYAWPGRRLKSAGVPNTTVLAGVGLALVGFFAIPVIGIVLGFVAGVWLAEAARLDGFGKAWPSTVAALKGVGLSMLVELGVGLLVAGTWIVGVLVA